jgi:hypothetical protein
MNMRRRAATAVGIVLAVAAAGGAMAFSDLLSDARRGERQAYAAALAEREQAADRSEQGPAQVPAETRSRTLCLRGAETVVARVARFLDSELLDEGGRLDVAALARTSRRAAEPDRGAALPQRMGRRRDGDTEAWQPIEPPDRICVELAQLPQGKRGARGAK